MVSLSKVRVIDAVDYHRTIGDTITVKATDDFMVTKVKIVTTNAAGALIEEGEAGPDTLKVNLWGYKATAANPTLESFSRAETRAISNKRCSMISCLRV